MEGGGGGGGEIRWGGGEAHLFALITGGIIKGVAWKPILITVTKRPRCVCVGGDYFRMLLWFISGCTSQTLTMCRCDSADSDLLLCSCHLSFDLL